MSQTEPEDPSRRELLANGWRYTALGALPAVGRRLLPMVESLSEVARISTV